MLPERGYVAVVAQMVVRSAGSRQESWLQKLDSRN